MRLIALFTLSIAVWSCAAAGEAPVQTICPITGKQLSSASSPAEVRVNGFRFLVLDVASSEQALANPAKAFAALAQNQEAADPISQICPIMGNRINRELFVQKDGYRIYICCAGCLKPVQGNWAKSLKKVAELAERGDPANAPGM